MPTHACLALSYTSSHVKKFDSMDPCWPPDWSALDWASTLGPRGAKRLLRLYNYSLNGPFPRLFVIFSQNIIIAGFEHGSLE